MTKTKKSSGLITASMAVSLAGCVLAVASVFCPYIVGGYGVAESTSLIKYIQLAFDNSNVYVGAAVMGGLVLGFVSVIGVFIVLALAFSIARKATPVIVFSALSLVVFFMMSSAFTSAGIVGDTLKWGAAYYMYIAGSAVACCGGVFMLVAKIKHKKSVASEEQEEIT